MLLLLQIREEIRRFGINIYQFPECDSDEEDDFKRQDQILKVCVSNTTFFSNGFLVGSSSLLHFLHFCCPLKGSIPFAVIGSNVQVEAKGRKFRGRAYPWGVVEGMRHIFAILKCVLKLCVKVTLET